MPQVANNNSRLSFHRLTHLLLVAILVFIPFQNLFSEVINHRTPLSDSLVFWLSHWYEPVIIIFLILLLLKGSFLKKILTSYKLALFFLSLGLISVLAIHPSGIGRSLEGFRITCFAASFFLLGIESDRDLWRKLERQYISIAVVVAVLAMVERSFPAGYWAASGLIAPGFGFGNFLVGQWQRSVSIIGGPNQLASYLLPAFFLMLCNFRSRTDSGPTWKRIVLGIFLAIVFFAIVFTFSRAAIIGLLVGIIIYLLFFEQSRKIKVAGLVILVAMFVMAGLAFAKGNLGVRDFSLHGASQGQHVQALAETWQEIKTRSVEKPVQLLLGGGLGTAGSLSVKYGNGLISESWYLQLLLEIGIVGLFAWLILIFFLLKNLLQSKSTGLFLGLTAVLVTSLFLHTFADNPAMAITLFTLMGINSVKNQDPRPQSKTFNIF